MKKNILVNIFIRYLALLAIVVISSYDFVYPILLKLTIYPAGYLLGFFYDLTITGNQLILNNQYFIEIIPACVAISAYCLLLILNLTTAMNWKQRAYSIGFSVISLLIVNILRIFLFSLLFTHSYSWFNIVHMLFWYGLSILLVILLWFASVYLFKIKNIPIYDDFKNIRNMNKK